MNESVTTADLVSQQIEDIKREVTETAVQSMVSQALEALAFKYEERDRQRDEAMRQFLADQRQKMSDEYRQMRSDALTAIQDFATKEEVEAKAREYAAAYFAPLRSKWDEQVIDFNRETARRNQMLDQHMAEVKAVAVRAEQKSLENETKIEVHKAESEQRFKQIENRLTKAENTIETSIAEVTRISNSMHRMLGDWVAEGKRRDEKNDLIFKEFKEAQEQSAKRIEIIESDARGAVDLAKEVDSLASRNYQVLNHAIVGNKDTKTKGLVDEMEELRAESRAQLEEVRKEQKALSAGQAALQTGLAWQAWIGRHPFISFQIAGMLFVILVIAVALILGRPEVIGALVNAAT